MRSRRTSRSAICGRWPSGTERRGAERELTDGSFSVLSYRLSRDGARIVTHRAPTPLAGDAARSEVWVSAADGAAARAVTSNAVEETDGELSPDNVRVLFVAEANDDARALPQRTLFVVPAAGGTPRPLAEQFPYAFERAAWSPDGSERARRGQHGRAQRDLPDRSRQAGETER